MGTITINGISIDPASDSPLLAMAGVDPNDASDSDYVLIQARSPLRAEQRITLKNAGAEILGREQTDARDDTVTYLCSYAPDSLAQLKNLDFVTMAMVYPKEVKIAPQLLSPDASKTAARFGVGMTPMTTMSQEPRTVAVVLHPGCNPADVIQEIARASRLDPSSLEANADHFQLHIRPQDLAALANIDAVHHIEEHKSAKLFDAVALNLIQADYVHSQVHLLGEGEVITVCDTGFDTGNVAGVHPAFAGRVASLYPWARATANDPSGHGTHVSGSALGDGHSAAMGGSVRGTAPAARLVVQSILAANGKLALPADLGPLFDQPYTSNGSRIHTNSWGSAVAGTYTPRSQQVDHYVWSHRDYVICFAAGNEGTDSNEDGLIDEGSICAPGTAKNCITIGASESLRPAISKPWGQPWPHDFPQPPIAGDLWADNPNGMAAFSSRGPTKDGRIKPDLVAPGTAILSARSRHASVGSFWGTSTDPDYCFMGGTSMATPLVAGCAAVVRQFLRQSGLLSPSAALVKAMLINSGVDMAGQYHPSEAGATPNFSEGFGRVNLSRAINAMGNDTLEFQDEANELDTGEYFERVVNVIRSGRTLKVTLVWTDLPGASLQNDLDLILVDPMGNTRHGNQSPGSTLKDRKNNVEQIEWENIPPGNCRIRVQAFDTPRFRQSFALVIRQYG